MIYQEGYIYHIKDEYFEKVKDGSRVNKLKVKMNEYSGNYRISYYAADGNRFPCVRDAVVEKAENIVDT